MNTKRKLAKLVALAAPAVGLVFAVSSATAHVDSPLLTEGCGSCHVGHGAPGEPMLSLSEERFCYQCHGSSDERNRMIAEGKLSPAAILKDVEAQFASTYHHPVEEGAGHSPREELPLLGGGSVNHSECVDCHNPHDKVRDGNKGVQKVKGFSLAGQRVESSMREYEICFKCHSDRMSVGERERNLTEDFAIDARSQHPVTRPSAGLRLPSLLSWSDADGMMDCSDCHRSDDANAARGPHGSPYRFLLSGNYDTGVYVEESPYAFSFCYSCHDRASILSDESFPYHSAHIMGDPIAGRPGTSCYTCHVSHGSRRNVHLLEFNARAVQPEDLTRRIEYRATTAGSGECYLKCHDHNHAPGRY